MEKENGKNTAERMRNTLIFLSIKELWKYFLSIKEYLHVGNTTFKEWNNYKKTFEKKIKNLRQKYKNYIYFVDEDTQKTCDRFIKSLAIWLVFSKYY